MEKIKLTVPDTGEEVEFFVLEQTRINNTNYILVTENEDEEETDAYILKDLSKDSDEEAVYEFVEDDKELDLVSDIFAELLDDIEIDK
ncbi:MAG: DUF1292 domain-containing protein [Lachnospiraceae bacterium]|nr:DUF1292 domain-containing protein [Lachnospiraceae bacterium]MDE6698049.1 DUF1292 domain-containing protein [Lachnospiraceae bacterium]